MKRLLLKILINKKDREVLIDGLEKLNTFNHSLYYEGLLYTDTLKQNDTVINNIKSLLQ